MPIVTPNCAHCGCCSDCTATDCGSYPYADLVGDAFPFGEPTARTVTWTGSVYGGPCIGTCPDCDLKLSGCHGFTYDVAIDGFVTLTMDFVAHIVAPSGCSVYMEYAIVSGDDLPLASGSGIYPTGNVTLFSFTQAGPAGGEFNICICASITGPTSCCSNSNQELITLTGNSE